MGGELHAYSMCDTFLGVVIIVIEKYEFIQ